MICDLDLGDADLRSRVDSPKILTLLIARKIKKGNLDSPPFCCHSWSRVIVSLDFFWILLLNFLIAGNYMHDWISANLILFADLMAISSVGFDARQAICKDSRDL